MGSVQIIMKLDFRHKRIMKSISMCEICYGINLIVQCSISKVKFVDTWISLDINV